MATLSFTFKVRQWRNYHTRNRAAAFVPLEHTQAVKSKYLYIFQSEDGAAPILKHEGKVISDNKIILKDARSSGAKATDADFSTGNTRDSIKLEREANNKNYSYYFYLSSIILQSQSILELEKNAKTLLPEIDISKTESFAYPENNPTSGLNVVRFLPVIDPLVVAENISDRYVSAHAKLVEFYTRPRQVTRTVRRRTIQKVTHTELVSEKRFVGGTLERILRQDPNDDLGVKSSFRGSDPNVMREDLRRIAKEEEKLNNTFETLADLLTRWLESKLYLFAEFSHREVEDECYHIFLNSSAKVHRDLSHSKKGLEFSIREFEKQSHLIKNYILPQSPVAGTVKSVISKVDGVHGAFLKMWTTTTVAVISSKGTGKNLQRVADSFNFLFGKASNSLLRVETLNSAKLLRFVKDPPDTDWASWVQDTSFMKNAVKEVADVFDLAFAIRDLFDNKKNAFEKTSAGLSVVSGSLSAISKLISASGKVTSQAAKKARELGLKRLAVAGAFISVISDTVAAVDAAQFNDDAVVLGNSISAFGSAVTLVGVITGSSVIGSIPGAVICVVGVIISVVGWIIATIGKDSALETMVSHCWWGNHFGDGTGQKPWTNGPLKDWKHHPKRISEAMLNVLFSYTLTSDSTRAGPRISMELKMGLLMDNSKFLLHWKVKDNHDREVIADFTYDPNKNALTLKREIKGKVRAKSARAVQSGGKNGLPLVVDFLPPRLDRSEGDLIAQFFEEELTIQLDLDGKGKSFIPTSGKKVGPVHTTGNPFFKDSATSLDR